MSSELQKALKKNISPLITDATNTAIENLCTEPTLTALYNITNYIDYVQGNYEK